MNYVITANERNTLLAESDRLAQTLFLNEELGTALYKALFNYVVKTAPVDKKEMITALGEAHTPDTMKAGMVKLLQSIVEVADSPETTVHYTTGQLARAFGVSTTTINNWIVSDRLIGVKKDNSHKQARIPETAIWVTTSGDRFTVREVIERFPNTSLAARKPLPHEALKELVDTVVHFEGKYHGELKASVLSRKLDAGEPFTAEEQRDYDEWRYLLRRLEGRR